MLDPYRREDYIVEKQDCEEDIYLVLNEGTSCELNKEELNIFYEFLNQVKKDNIDKSKESKELVSLYNDLIQFNPFQYKPYLNLISEENEEKCIYIADEVGAGKTFETGILISELLHSEKIHLTDSILIICPNMLCRKWQEVLHSFYGLSSKITNNLKKIGNLSIVSYDTISRAKEEDLEQITNIKLLIIDEAHNASGERFKKLLRIRKKSEYAVLLSATPLAGKVNNKLIQSQLLFGEQKNEFDLTKESCYFNRTLKDEMRSKTVESCIKNIDIQNKPLEAFIEVSKEIFNKKNTIKKYAGLNMIMSSPAAAEQYYKRLSNLTVEQIKELLLGSKFDKEQLEAMGIEESNLEELEMQEEDLEQVGITPEKAEAIKLAIKEIANEVKNDAKLEQLKKIINENKINFERGTSDSKFYKKLVVFTHYNATAHYLGKEIENSIIINGECTEAEKWQNFNQFKDENSNKDVLIITNVACEGQDMDFCNTIVNYDLTYNPVKLAQRKGRVDRFEIYEGKNKIFIYNFMVANVDPSDEEITRYINDGSEEIMKYNNSIYPILLKKLKRINVETGIYYRVIDNIGNSFKEIDKKKSRNCVLRLFKSQLNDELSDYESIMSLSEKYLQESNAKVNQYLQYKGIEVVEKKDGLITFVIEENNKDFLKYIFDGGTVNSHLINNK